MIFNTLNSYVSLCENYWKESHGFVHEQKMDELLRVKCLVVRMYALSGFDLYYALFVVLRHLRKVMPPIEQPDYANINEVFEQIRIECMTQIKMRKEHDTTRYRHQRK